MPSIARVAGCSRCPGGVLRVSAQYFLALACSLGLMAPATSEPPPLSLHQATSEAVEKNLDLLAKRFDIKIAQAKILTAHMRPNPTLSVGADHLDLLGTGYNSDNAAGPPEYSLRTDWTLEGGGKQARRIEVAERSKTVTEYRLQDSVRQLVFEVEGTFVDALLAQRNLALAHENRTAFARIVRISRDRVRYGDLAKVELMRTRLAEMQFETTVIQTTAKLRASKQHLFYLMGRTPVEDDYELEGSLLRPSGLRTADELERLALTHRPDYLALAKDEERAESAIRLEEAKGQIDYVIGGEIRRQQGLAGRGNSVGFFIGVPLPIFDDNSGEIQRAQVELEQARANTKALAAQIHKELQTTLNYLRASEATVLQIESQMLTQSRQVLDTMEYSYRAGQASLVELLDAQRAYNDVMVSYNEALAEYSRNNYRLESIVNVPPNELFTQAFPALDQFREKLKNSRESALEKIADFYSNSGCHTGCGAAERLSRTWSTRWTTANGHGNAHCHASRPDCLNEPACQWFSQFQSRGFGDTGGGSTAGGLPQDGTHSGAGRAIRSDAQR